MSVINLIYEYIRAFKIMRRGSVAESFLDHLATRIECLRMGSGRGWKRFLVFAELTKSKKGAEYIALFTFFSFQSWIRVLLCAGPRQVVNGFTLFSVYKAKLEIEGNNFDSSLASFIEKIKALATEETRQAVILCGMLYTVVVWIFSFLSLLLAALCFICYLWGYIPRADGGLTGFCERKVNKRLKEIVTEKISKALEDDERRRRKAEVKAAKKTGENRPITLKPSLPVLNDDDLPAMPAVKRADTFMSISEKTDVSTGSFEMSQLGGKRPMPSRAGTTKTSVSQYSSRASLIGGAADMGGYPLSRTNTGTSTISYGPPRLQSPAPTVPSINMGNYPPSRAPTTASSGTYGPGPQNQMQRMPSNGSALDRGYTPGPASQMQRMPPNGSAALDRGYTASPAIFSSDTAPPLPIPGRMPLNGPNSYRGPGQPQPGNRWQGQDQGRQPALPALEPSLPILEPTLPNLELSLSNGAPSLPNLPTLPNLEDPASGRASLASSTISNRNGPVSPPRTGPGGYPLRSATNPMPPRGPGPYPPQRNMTAPMQQQPSYHRSTGSNSSGGSAGRSVYHQQSPSNSSLRNMTMPGTPYGRDQNGDEYEYPPRSNTAPVAGRATPVVRQDEDDYGYPLPRSNTMPVTGSNNSTAGQATPAAPTIHEDDEYEYPPRQPTMTGPARSNTTFTTAGSYLPQQQTDGGYGQQQNRANTMPANNAAATGGSYQAYQPSGRDEKDDDGYGYPQPGRANTMPLNNNNSRGPAPPSSRQNYGGGWSEDLERGDGGARY